MIDAPDITSAELRDRAATLRRYTDAGVMPVLDQLEVEARRAAQALDAAADALDMADFVTSDDERLCMLALAGGAMFGMVLGAGLTLLAWVLL